MEMTRWKLVLGISVFKGSLMARSGDLKQFIVDSMLPSSDIDTRWLVL